MNRRLLIKRSDVWSKSEAGVIKLTEALSCKRSLRASQDFVNKVACSGILSPFLLTCYTRNGLSAEAKSFPTKKSSSKLLPNGKCGAWNACIYFIVVLFYSNGQSSSSDALFYFDFTGSVYVACTWIKDLKDNMGLFYLYDIGENKYTWHFCLNASNDWASIVFHCLCEIIIQNWIRFNYRGNFKASPSYCHARLTEGTKQEL